MEDLKNVTVAILAGGLGTRIAPILPGKQKVIARVKDHPFLEYILNQLDKAGFKKVVICIGYLGDQVEVAFGNNYHSLSLSYSKESSPLGTAGALRLALPVIKSERILVMNGDTYCNVDLEKFVKFHFDKKANASLVVCYVSDTTRYGSVNLNANDEIVGFEEKKSEASSGWINGGVYLINRSELLRIAENKEVSLEKEIFPSLIGESFYGYKSKGDFIDIGTPASYKEAQEFFSEHSL